MKSVSRWLLVLAMAVCVGASAWFLRAWLESGVRNRLTQKFEQQVASLADARAALLIRRLALDDGQWVEVLVAASGDQRPAVAAAAETELRELVDRWTELPPEESSPRVAHLAHLLAEQAPHLAAARRRLAHSLALRLLDWPVDGRLVDSARLIADCEKIVLLGWGGLSEIRMVQAPAVLPAEPLAGRPPAAAPVLPQSQSAPPQTSSPLAEVRSPPLPPVAPPAVANSLVAPPSVTSPREPGPLPEANREAPQQLRPFKPARGMRISDDE